MFVSTGHEGVERWATMQKTEKQSTDMAKITKHLLHLIHDCAKNTKKYHSILYLLLKDYSSHSPILIFSYRPCKYKVLESEMCCLI